MIYSFCLLLILIGLYGVVASRQTLKIVICLTIMDHGVNLLLLLIGYRQAGAPPIVDPAISIAENARYGFAVGSGKRTSMRRPFGFDT